jgi:hypothetical protein
LDSRPSTKVELKPWPIVEQVTQKPWLDHGDGNMSGVRLATDTTRRHVVQRVTAEREVNDLGAALLDRPDHLAGHRHLAGEAVAVERPVHGDLGTGRDLLDDAGDECAMSGIEVEISVPGREREPVERVDVVRVVRARYATKPPVCTDFGGYAGVDDRHPGGLPRATIGLVWAG